MAQKIKEVVVLRETTHAKTDTHTKASCIQICYKTGTREYPRKKDEEAISSELRDVIERLHLSHQNILFSYIRGS